MAVTHITAPKHPSRSVRARLLTGAALAGFGVLFFVGGNAFANDDVRGYIPPLPELQLEFEPLYPDRLNPTVAREEAQIIADAERANREAMEAQARAKHEAKMRMEPAESSVPFKRATESGRIAPIPTGIVGAAAVPAQHTHKRKDIIEPIDVQAPPAIAGTQTLRLGKDTKEAIAALPSRLDQPVQMRPGRIDLDRVSPDILDVVNPEEQYKDFEKAGIRIEMHRGVYDSSRQLSNAYNALVSGDDLSAVTIYREIVANDPKNQEALFGLATTYHRAGSYDLAKPVYSQLLKVNPEHREGLNNFLSMIAESAPEDALVELEKLAQRNPHFSPLHAQIGMLYSKLGAHDRAREKMLYAVKLAPHNLVYQYNLAVLLDQRGEYSDAIAIYKKLVSASGRGAPLPVDVDDVQRRMNFLINRYQRASR